MRRALLVLLVALVASSATAQVGATAVRSAAKSWTEEQILANVTGNRVPKPIQWGRVVRYGGNIIMAAGLIYAALDWFYDQAQQSTGTDLDDYGFGSPTGPVAFNCLIYRPVGGGGLYDCRLGSSNSGTVISSGSYGVSNPPTAEEWATVWGTGAAAWSGAPGEFSWAAVYVLPGNGEVACQGGLASNQWRRCYLTLGRPDLDTVLDGSAAARNALRNQVLPSYLTHQEQGSQWPFTYEQPYGPGIELDPIPNRNQWYDNPYANPELDTDGDGWEDWKEVVSGTDPTDPDSYPTVDPAPEPEPGDDPYPDSDGDGIPDAFDPCPYDALNRCADNGGGGQQEPIEIPDDYARELTLQELRAQATRGADAAERTADASEEILSLLQEQSELTGEVVMPELEAAWEGVTARMEASLTAIRTAAEGKVGFNAGGLIPQLTASGGGSCEEITITLLGITRGLGWCSSSFYNLVTTWGRNGIALLMLIGFAFASARTIGSL